MTDDATPLAFEHTPSRHRIRRAAVSVANAVTDGPSAVGVFVPSSGPVPRELGLDRAALTASGLEGKPGQTLTVPTSTGPMMVAVGVGDGAQVDAAELRNAAGAFARAAASHERLAVLLEEIASISAESAAQAVTEGVLLARYQFDILKSDSKAKPVRELTLIGADVEALNTGLERGVALAGATALARDLANTPHNYLTASRMAEIAGALGAELGFQVEVFDETQMAEMGIGGLLGVNAGSAEPPRLIKLSYSPTEAKGRLGMVGKGIMYDSGGLALKPGDAVHAAMKNDMSGAGAILAAVAALAETGARTAVTGYLMCTDSMPSSTAMAMGDVITIRGGTTIEVVNTDAEGRLVMADGLVLAREDGHDAIIDIATLTGACMRALGTEIAGVFGNNQGLVDQISAAGELTDEPVWQLPLYKGYRKQLDSPVADMKNLGYGEGGAITAALFLEEFVDDVPWAHIDMAGTALSTDGRPWHTPGCTGFGARLLVELATSFSAPADGGTR